MAKDKAATRKSYAPGYKQCPSCEVFVKGPRTATCPACNKEFPAKPSKPKAKAKKTTAKRATTKSGDLDVREALAFASKVGSIEAAQEQLDKLKALKALSNQVKDL